MEMGLPVGVAIDQDEPPIAFNLGDPREPARPSSTATRRATANLQTEIQNGCSPRYQEHPFTYTPYCPTGNSPAALLGPHPAPWDVTNNWPPPQCVVTQTGTGEPGRCTGSTSASSASTTTRAARWRRALRARPQLLARREQRERRLHRSRRTTPAPTPRQSAEDHRATRATSRCSSPRTTRSRHR